MQRLGWRRRVLGGLGAQRGRCPCEWLWLGLSAQRPALGAGTPSGFLAGGSGWATGLEHGAGRGPPHPPTPAQPWLFSCPLLPTWPVGPWPVLGDVLSTPWAPHYINRDVLGPGALVASARGTGVSGKGDGTVWKSRGLSPVPEGRVGPRAPKLGDGLSVPGQGDRASWGQSKDSRTKVGTDLGAGKRDVGGPCGAGATEGLGVSCCPGVPLREMFTAGPWSQVPETGVGHAVSWGWGHKEEPLVCFPVTQSLAPAPLRLRGLI